MRQKCKHLKVSFLGMQETTSPEKQLALYNCEHCHTTLSVPVLNVRSVNRKARKTAGMHP